MLNKTCTWIGKNHAIPSFSDRKKLSAKKQDSGLAGMRRVTQPPHIAGPLAQIFQYVTIIPSRLV